MKALPGPTQTQNCFCNDLGCNRTTVHSRKCEAVATRLQDPTCLHCDGKDYAGVWKEIECNFKQFTFKNKQNYLAEDILNKCKITDGLLHVKDRLTRKHVPYG